MVDVEVGLGVLFFCGVIEDLFGWFNCMLEIKGESLDGWLFVGGGCSFCMIVLVLIIMLFVNCMSCLMVLKCCS